MDWLLVTGAFPPDAGGVADYSIRIAEGLVAKGDRVTVVAGPNDWTAVPLPGGVSLERLPEHFTPKTLGKLVGMAEGREVLVQYVPQAFGPRAGSRFKGLPLWFCEWLRGRRMRARVTTMIHEARVEWGPGMAAKVLHVASRRMLGSLVQGSDRIFVSTEAWRGVVAPHAKRGQKIETLPVPSNVATAVDEAEVASKRAGLGQKLIFGHFGTFREPVAGLLEGLMGPLNEAFPEAGWMFTGAGSQEFAMRLPEEVRQRVVATGPVSDREVAEWIRTADVMVQPYADGVTSRRGSLVAALALGVPVVSNDGEATEARWRKAGGLRMVERYGVEEYIAGLRSVLGGDRAAMGDEGRVFYEGNCSVGRTVEELRKLG